MVAAEYTDASGRAIGAIERHGSAAAPMQAESAPTPQRITETDEFPTRDTPWAGEGKLKGKTVREWAINQLRAAESGEVKIPDEWLEIVKLELQARAAKVASGTA